MLYIKQIYVEKLTFFHSNSFVSEDFEVIFWCWMVKDFFPWFLLVCFFVVSLEVFSPIRNNFFFERLFEKFFHSFFPPFDSYNTILMSRTLIHAFNNFCFRNIELDRLKEILRIIIVVSNLTTCRDFVHILSSVPLARDIMNGDILTGVLDYLIDTFSEIVGYFLKSHDASMP